MTLEAVRARMHRAAERSGRSVEDVRLVAVTKGRAPSEIEPLLQAGQVDFGENRAQELREKAPALTDRIRWHFIGPLQTNKVRIVRPAVTLLHSMDRLTLASAWMKGSGMPPPALLQVNIGRETQKHGVAPDVVDAAVEEMVSVGVRLIGLMAIAPLVADPEAARPYFIEMRHLRDRLRTRHPEIVELSMGMTDDFEVAIEEGATMIRVGRAIFAG